MLLSLVLSGCLWSCVSCDGPGTQDVRFEAPNTQTITTRFRGQSDAPLEPVVAFEVEKRCPRITRAVVDRVPGGQMLVTAEGEGFDTVKAVAAGLPGGKLAAVQFERGLRSALVDGASTAEGDPEVLQFPVLCDRCDVWLGVSAAGRFAACLGPGRSLRVEGGRVVK